MLLGRPHSWSSLSPRKTKLQRRRNRLGIFVVLILSAFSTFAMLRSFANIIEGNDARVDTDAELTYYLKVKEDGVDAAGIESSDIQVASIYSGRISVTDKLPDGLIFQGFVTTSDGTIGAISRADSSIQCSGKVIDDTNEDTLNTGTWNNAHTEYYYHGLHYDDATRTVSFMVEKLKAGCELTVGIMTKTPAEVDDPTTTVVETRRDFYNSAFAAEKNITTISNTVHAWIGNSSARVFKVRYSYTGNIPSGAPTTPTEQSHPANNEVAVSMNPTLEGYTFSGWTTSDATVTDGSFTMPGQDVELVGIWTKNTANTKCNVTYVVNGDKPADFMPPAQKEYEAGTTVDLDSTAKDTVIDGYKFSGWSTQDATLSETGFTMPEGNVTLTGSFERVSYKVCYEFEGAVSPDDANSLLPPCETYYPGETVTTAADPQADGYNFLGWYKNASFTMPEGNVTIQGEWTRAMDKFTPTIVKSIINSKDDYMYGETVKFKVTVTNTAAYKITDVYLQEELDGAIFASPADDSYTIKTSTIAVIPTIAANSSIDVYAEYKVTENKAQTLTNTVELTGALAEDHILDTDKEYKATIDFKTIPEPVPFTGIIFNALPYVGLVGLGVGILAFTVATSKKRDLKDRLSCIPCIRISRSKRTLHYALSALAIVSVIIGGIIAKLTYAANYTEVIKSIELTSQHASYANGDPGSWHVTKSAKWIEQGKARITFDVDTVAKVANNANLDIVMVVDSSGSMRGEKIAQLKHDASELVEEILADTENRIALINFNGSAHIMSGLSNNKTSLLSLINNISPHDHTNYYDGFKKAEEVLEGYQKQENRELILLFLTDGYPNKQTPNEIPEYQAIKAMYPYMTINGIQYEMGDEILDPIKKVSDNQFIANMSTLRDVLFEASLAPYTYEDFTLTDYINDEYWDVDSIDAVEASIGETALNYNNNTPVVTWTMNNALMSGHTAQLTIDVTIKNASTIPEGTFLPTNDHETIQTTIPEVLDENIESELTPVLKSSYKISYEANLPSDCSSYEGTVPIEQDYQPLAVVQKSNNTLSCSGYNFNGWEIAEGDSRILNDDYFKLMEDDVILRATWAKPSISKSMDGEVKEEITAVLDNGQNINAALKKLSGQSDATYKTQNTTITAVKTATSMNPVQEASAAIISATNSPVPIYAWFDDTDGSIYIYSEADKIKANNLAYLFNQFTRLVDISGLAGWDVSNVVDMGGAFRYTASLTNIDALANWNTSKVAKMTEIFTNASSLTNIDALANWDTSKVTHMNIMFSGASSLANIDALANWDTSKVADMSYAFRDTNSLTNIDALANWNTSSVTNMVSMFSNATSLINIDGASNWNTSKVTNMNIMFSGASSLTNIDGASNWDTSKVTNMNGTFTNASSLTNIDALANWDTSNVTNMSSMFRGASNLIDIGGATGWNTSKVANMSYMFQKVSKLADIDALSNWDTSNVTDMNGMFRNASSLTNIDGAINWDTPKVANMSYMFYSASSLENIDGAINWDTSSVTNMNYMFQDASSLVNIDGAANWNTSSVTNMSNMFYSASSLANINGALGWITISVANMSDMFNGASSLADIGGAINWDTSNVEDMNEMFRSTRINNINALANWDFSKTTSLHGMFRAVSSLTNIDGAANWNTSNITDISNMFYGTRITNVNALSGWNIDNVTNLSSLFRATSQLADISGLASWNTSNVINMSATFQSTSNLTNIDALASWDTINVTDMNNMFANDQGLVDISVLANWDVSNVLDMSAMFQGLFRLTSVEAIAGWDTSKVRNVDNMFYGLSGVLTFEPLNDWDTSSLLSKNGTFDRVSSSAPLPTWYLGD